MWSEVEVETHLGNIHVVRSIGRKAFISHLGGNQTTYSGNICVFNVRGKINIFIFKFASRMTQIKRGIYEGNRFFLSPSLLPIIAQNDSHIYQPLDRSKRLPHLSTS